MVPGPESGLAWSQLPPITWAVIIAILTNVFYSGMNYMRMKQLEDYVKKHQRRLGRHESVLWQIAPKEMARKEDDDPED